MKGNQAVLTSWTLLSCDGPLALIALSLVCSVRELLWCGECMRQVGEEGRVGGVLGGICAKVFVLLWPQVWYRSFGLVCVGRCGLIALHLSYFNLPSTCVSGLVHVLPPTPISYWFSMDPATEAIWEALSRADVPMAVRSNMPIWYLDPIQHNGCGVIEISESGTLITYCQWGTG